MRHPAFLLLSLAFAVFISGCKKEDDVPPIPEGPGDVYICGSEDIGSEPYPRYWKNGQQFNLYSANRPATATYIWVNDKHAFAGGSIREVGSVQDQPCYWIDDELFELDNDAGSTHCTILAIYVKGEDEIYSAGHIRGANGFNKAMYWNGSAAVELTDGSTDAEAHGIWVEGNDVYVCGYEDNQAFGGEGVAKYWVNGNPVILGSGEGESHAYDIRVVNGDVIVVGTDDDVEGSNNDEQAVVWINGKQSVYTHQGGGAFCLFHEGDKMYVGGYQSFANWLPRYWVNSVSIEPYLPPGWIADYAVASIFVRNDVVHTLGEIYTNNTTQTIES